MPVTSSFDPKMLPTRVTYMLTFFDALGYNSGSSKLSNKHLTANLICISHILLAISFTFFYFNIRLPPSTQFLEIINQLLQYFSSMCLYWLTIWDSFHHWREHHRFWKIYQKINESFQIQHNFTFRLFILKLFSIILSTFLSFLICYFVFDSTYYMKEMLLNSIWVKLCQFRVCYYLFCLELMNFQLKSIESALNQINERINVPSDGAAKRFKWIQEYYYCVYKMVTLMNVIFDWSQIAAVIFCFNALVTDLNWICTHIHELSPSYFLGKCRQTDIFYFEIAKVLQYPLINFFIVASILWMFHTPMILLYMFSGTTRCFNTVML